MNASRILNESRYSDELGARVARLVEQLRQGPGHKKVVALPTGSKSLIKYPRVFGTSGLGDSTGYSLLDRDNLVQVAGNLYVVDASYIPSRDGTKPRQTIRANASEVAGLIHPAPPASASRNARHDTPTARTGGHQS